MFFSKITLFLFTIKEIFRITPSLFPKRAPLSPQAPLNGLYTPFGSPVSGGQKPQEAGM